jgi:hypothetical protein
MDPTERARLSLDGLSVGDAFGERFFGIDEHVAGLVARRATPGGHVWPYTDDTEMALSVVEQLARAGAIDPIREHYESGLPQYVEQELRGQQNAPVGGISGSAG